MTIRVDWLDKVDLQIEKQNFLYSQKLEESSVRVSWLDKVDLKLEQQDFRYNRKLEELTVITDGLVAYAEICQRVESRDQGVVMPELAVVETSLQR